MLGHCETSLHTVAYCLKKNPTVICCQIKKVTC